MYDDIPTEIEAYAAYLNAPRQNYEYDELVKLNEDTAKAKAHMERAWLNAKPVKDVHRDADTGSDLTS